MKSNDLIGNFGGYSTSLLASPITVSSARALEEERSSEDEIDAKYMQYKARLERFRES
jgi:hypothetical protein